MTYIDRKKTNNSLQKIKYKQQTIFLHLCNSTGKEFYFCICLKTQIVNDIDIRNFCGSKYSVGEMWSTNVVEIGSSIGSEIYSY